MYVIGLSSVNWSACQLYVGLQWYENSNISDPELCHRCKLTLSSQQTMATSSGGESGLVTWDYSNSTLL